MVTIQKAAPCSKGSVASITLENANGMRVALLSYGATVSYTPLTLPTKLEA